MSAEKNLNVFLKVFPVWFLLNYLYLAGGPLIQRSDGSLIGITSFGEVMGEIDENTTVATLLVFTRVHAYYGWISNVTGLDMPECVN